MVSDPESLVPRAYDYSVRYLPLQRTTYSRICIDEKQNKILMVHDAGVAQYDLKEINEEQTEVASKFKGNISFFNFLLFSSNSSSSSSTNFIIDKNVDEVVVIGDFITLQCWKDKSSFKVYKSGKIIKKDEGKGIPLKLFDQDQKLAQISRISQYYGDEGALWISSPHDILYFKLDGSNPEGITLNNFWVTSKHNPKPALPISTMILPDIASVLGLCLHASEDVLEYVFKIAEVEISSPPVSQQKFNLKILHPESKYFQNIIIFLCVITPFIVASISSLERSIQPSTVIMAAGSKNGDQSIKIIKFGDSSMKILREKIIIQEKAACLRLHSRPVSQEEEYIFAAYSTSIYIVQNRLDILILHKFGEVFDSIIYDFVLFKHSIFVISKDDAKIGELMIPKDDDNQGLLGGALQDKGTSENKGKRGSIFDMGPEGAPPIHKKNIVKMKFKEGKYPPYPFIYIIT